MKKPNLSLLSTNEMGRRSFIEHQANRKLVTGMKQALDQWIAYEVLTLAKRLELPLPNHNHARTYGVCDDDLEIGGLRCAVVNGCSLYLLLPSLRWCDSAGTSTFDTIDALYAYQIMRGDDEQ